MIRLRDIMPLCRELTYVRDIVAYMYASPKSMRTVKEILKRKGFCIDIPDAYCDRCPIGNANADEATCFPPWLYGGGITAIDLRMCILTHVMTIYDRKQKSEGV